MKTYFLAALGLLASTPPFSNARSDGDQIAAARIINEEKNPSSGLRGAGRLLSVSGPFDDLSNVHSSDNFSFQKTGSTAGYNAYIKTTVRISEVTFLPDDTDKHKRIYLTTSKPYNDDGVPNSGIVAMVGLFDKKRIYIQDPSSGETIEFANGYDEGDNFILRNDYDQSKIYLYKNGEKLHTFEIQALDLYASIWLYEPDIRISAEAVPREIELSFFGSSGIEVLDNSVFHVLTKISGCIVYDEYAATFEVVRRLYFSAGETFRNKKLILATTPVLDAYPSDSDIVAIVGLFEDSELHAGTSAVPGTNLELVDGYTEEDDFILDIVGIQVNLYKNGSLLHTFPNPGSGDLYASVWLKDPFTSLTVRAE